MYRVVVATVNPPKRDAGGWIKSIPPTPSFVQLGMKNLFSSPYISLSACLKSL